MSTFFDKSTEKFIRKLSKGEVLLTGKKKIDDYKKLSIKDILNKIISQLKKLKCPKKDWN